MEAAATADTDVLVEETEHDGWGANGSSVPKTEDESLVGWADDAAGMADWVVNIDDWLG